MAAKNLHADAALMHGAMKRGLSWYHICAPNLNGLRKIEAQNRFAEPAGVELGPPTIMKFVGLLGEQRLYSLTDPTVPDELNAAQSIGKFSISGTKKVDVARIDGQIAAHFGKAFVFNAREAQGIATVGVSNDGDHAYYIFLLLDRKNRCIELPVPMQKGATYTWKLTTLGSTAKLTVADASGDIGSVECREYREFAIAACARYPGDPVDLTVLLQ